MNAIVWLEEIFPVGEKMYVEAVSNIYWCDIGESGFKIKAKGNASGDVVNWVEVVCYGVHAFRRWCRESTTLRSKRFEEGASWIDHFLMKSSTPSCSLNLFYACRI